MIDFIRENMAPIMFGSLVLFLLIGYPAAFSLAAVGLFGGLAAIELGLIAPQFFGNLTYQLYGVLSNELLLAIPFFTLMGVILEKSGMAEDLLEGFGQLFGGIRGGLSYAVIIVGAILGAITGTVAASVIAMGLISLPVMMRYGYNVRHATGVIAASGTITQLIPPSLVLIVLADQLQRSPGEMYIGATGASIVQVLLFMGWVFILSIIRPQDVPALPPEARTLKGWPLWKMIIRGTVPSLALIFIVLGTILLGLVTPTEAGAMGVVGALLLAWMNGRLSWAVTWGGMLDHAADGHGRIHPARRARLHAGVSGRRRRSLDRAPAVQFAGRRRRLPDFRQYLRLHPGVLSRFLRDRLHRHPAAGPGR